MPGWSRTISTSVLLRCTFLYAMIAGIVVDIVGVVFNGSGVEEKLLGVTLFALVMSFAINGNIGLRCADLSPQFVASPRK